ncbi:hypothetical protein BGP80_09745 [Pseudomonas putida]|uniref:Uncharacterized protein n=2 Tax=Pseudomonas putida TaxID=303 RepID=A0A2S3WBD8_PSEPU|nr:hypothetical protein BGP80_09745 [Pseudomonas putida]
MSLGEFLPGITLPAQVHGLLRQRLSEIEVSDTPTNCLIAQVRAESLVEALAAMKAVSKEGCERLFKIIMHSAGARLEELNGPV